MVGDTAMTLKAKRNGQEVMLTPSEEAAIVAERAEDVKVDPMLVRAEAQRQINQLGPQYLDGERQTWATQIEEAKLVSLNPLATPPLLTRLARGRGITVPAMAQRVLDKVDAFSQAAGDILEAQEKLLSSDPIPQDYANPVRWPAAVEE